MILDNALAGSVILGDRMKKRLLARKSSTRRFVFNEDASHKSGRFAADCIDIICRKVDDIITPFPNTYVEIDNRACLRGGHTDNIDRAAADRLGFWWTDNGQCFVIAGDDKLAEFQPFIYAEHGSDAGLSLHDHYFNLLDEANKLQDRKYMDNYELFKQYLMIGRVPTHLLEAVEQLGHRLTSRYEIGISAVPRVNSEILEGFFHENVGTYKMALSVLLLLDERVKRQLIHVPARQKIINGKARGIPKHELVTIDLDVPSIRKTFEHGPHGTHDHQIEHDVSSHWTHSNVSSQCEHVWRPFYSEEAERRDRKYGHAVPLRREACALCGGLRTRKPAHTKGDANKGSTVGKRGYKVIASKEKNKD